MGNKKLTGTLIPKDNKKAKMHATFYSDKPIGGGGDSEIFDEYIDATDQQRNTALANVSNQTANSTTGKMGYKVLDPTKTFASQVTDENTIYEIRDVFDLGGTQETPVSVTLPAGSTLKFNGGIIKNCNIDLNSCNIDASSKIFDNVTPVENSVFVQDISPMWFGAIGNDSNDDTDAWEDCLAFAKQIKPANLNAIREYTRPQVRISAPKHANFKITRPINVTFQCDIVGGFKFLYYGAFPSENTGIVNFYGVFSQCIYQFDVIHRQLSPSITTPFYPDWTNVPQFAGVCVGSSDNPTIMEECQITIGVFSCQIGIRLYGHDGSHYISCNTFRNCRFSVCIIGIENCIHEVDSSSAWNNDTKFFDCEFRPSSSGYAIPTNTERFAFVKVDGNGSLQMNASVIDGLSLEGKPFNKDVSILWVDKSGQLNPTYGIRISNVRIENIGYAYIKSNCPFINGIIDDAKVSNGEFIAVINNITFYSTHTDIPGFAILAQNVKKPIYSYNSKEVLDYAKACKNNIGTTTRIYRTDNRIIVENNYLGDCNVKKANEATSYYRIGIPFEVKNGGILQINQQELKSSIDNSIFVICCNKTTFKTIDVSNGFVCYGGYLYKASYANNYYGFSKQNDNYEELTICNNSGADVIMSIMISPPAPDYNYKVYGYNASLYSFEENYKVEGTSAEMPILFPEDNGYTYHCSNGIDYTFDNIKGWLTESGFTSNIRSGATTDRPQLGFTEDGYKFYDTTINRNIYSKVSIDTPVVSESVDRRSNSVINNTLSEGKIYWIGYSTRQSWGGKVAFRKTNDTSTTAEDEIVAIPNFLSYDLGVYFTAPPVDEYPYIFIENDYNLAETITFSLPKTDWIEEDGANAGVVRSGTTSQRPAIADVYVGFQYFDTDLGKYICSDGTAWVNLDGTALS